MLIDHYRDCPLCDGMHKCRWHSGEEFEDPRPVKIETDDGIWEGADPWWIGPLLILVWVVIGLVTYHLWSIRQ